MVIVPVLFICESVKDNGPVLLKTAFKDALVIVVPLRFDDPVPVIVKLAPA